MLSSSLSRGDNNCQWGFAGWTIFFKFIIYTCSLRFAAFIVFQIITWANINSKWHLALMKTGFSRFRLETANSISDWGPIPSNLTYHCPCDATCVYPSFPISKKENTLERVTYVFGRRKSQNVVGGLKTPLWGLAFCLSCGGRWTIHWPLYEKRKICFIFEWVLYFRIYCTGSITSDYTSTCVITHITTNKGQAPFY